MSEGQVSEKELNAIPKELREYILEQFGEIRPSHLMMARYNPDQVKGFLAFRKAILPSEETKGRLPRKTREFVRLAVEVATRGGAKGISPARAAVRLGATPAEVHEVVSIVQMLAGMETYVECGIPAVKAAEEEALKLKTKKK
jgi:alkylhydroperoxidase/carboxymuconolactone decarboxylase family protein YurZ